MGVALGDFGLRDSLPVPPYGTSYTGRLLDFQRIKRYMTPDRTERALLDQCELLSRCLSESGNPKLRVMRLV